MAYKKIYVNDLYEIFYPQIVISFSHNNKNVRSAWHEVATLRRKK